MHGASDNMGWGLWRICACQINTHMDNIVSLEVLVLTFIWVISGLLLIPNNDLFVNQNFKATLVLDNQKYKFGK